MMCSWRDGKLASLKYVTGGGASGQCTSRVPVSCMSSDDSDFVFEEDKGGLSSRSSPGTDEDRHSGGGAGGGRDSGIGRGRRGGVGAGRRARALTEEGKAAVGRMLRRYAAAPPADRAAGLLPWLDWQGCLDSTLAAANQHSAPAAPLASPDRFQLPRTLRHLPRTQ